MTCLAFNLSAICAAICADSRVVKAGHIIYVVNRTCLPMSSFLIATGRDVAVQVAE